jgi:hypothetical protein
MAILNQERSAESRRKSCIGFRSNNSVSEAEWGRGLRGSSLAEEDREFRGVVSDTLLRQLAAIRIERAWAPALGENESGAELSPVSTRGVVEADLAEALNKIRLVGEPCPWKADPTKEKVNLC